MTAAVLQPPHSNLMTTTNNEESIIKTNGNTKNGHDDTSSSSSSSVAVAAPANNNNKLEKGKKDKINDKFYELAPLDSSDEPYPFSELKGKVVLIVNVASKCGFTPQYKNLEILHDKFHSQGLQIIAFPSDSFKQERGSQKQILQFCYLNFGIKFPIMKKVMVNGSETDDVYKFLKNEKSGFLGIKSIKWNFEKFLINKQGQIVARYSSFTNPKNLEDKIEKLLKE